MVISHSTSPTVPTTASPDPVSVASLLGKLGGVYPELSPQAVGAARDADVRVHPLDHGYRLPAEGPHADGDGRASTWRRLSEPTTPTDRPAATAGR